MNIYICSTVRHLLFALCRANRNRHEQHHLLFFADYQHVTLRDWNIANLPANTHLVDLERCEFRRRLEQTLAGRVSYQYSRTLFAAPAGIQQPVIDTLAAFAPELAAQLRLQPPVALWLFNDRNRMARLFRLLSPTFRVIEDGESNYLLYRVPWWKRPLRLLLGQPLRQRAIGDDPRCAEIWVSHPECLPDPIRSKGRAIDFLEGALTAAFIRQIMGRNMLPDVTGRSVVLATQPIDGMATMPVADKQAIYGTIVEFLERHSLDVILKLHPAERPADYEFLQRRVTAAPAKFPVEALLMSAVTPPLLLSVSSSAGLGFERFCKRIRLIGNNDFVTMRRWAAQPGELMQCLEQSFAALQSSAADAAAQAQPQRLAL